MKGEGAYPVRFGEGGNLITTRKIKMGQVVIPCTLKEAGFGSFEEEVVFYDNKRYLQRSATHIDTFLKLGDILEANVGIKRIGS